MAVHVRWQNPDHMIIWSWLFVSLQVCNLMLSYLGNRLLLSYKLKIGIEPSK